MEFELTLDAVAQQPELAQQLIYGPRPRARVELQTRFWNSVAVIYPACLSGVR